MGEWTPSDIRSWSWNASIAGIEATSIPAGLIAEDACGAAHASSYKADFRIVWNEGRPPANVSWLKDRRR